MVICMVLLGFPGSPWVAGGWLSIAVWKPYYVFYGMLYGTRIAGYYSSTCLLGGNCIPKHTTF